MNYIDRKIEEYVVLSRNRRRIESTATMQRFEFPPGGQANFQVDDEDVVGVTFSNYVIRLEQINKRLKCLTVKQILDGSERDLPGTVSHWCISKEFLQSKMIYWHKENNSVVFTHRFYGRLTVTYAASHFDDYIHQLTMGFDIYGIRCSETDNASDDSDQAVQVPSKEEFPFYKAF